MRGSSEWGPIYMLVVLAIAAVLLVTFVKPLFSSASSTASTVSGAAKDAAQSSAYVLAFFPVFGFMRRLLAKLFGGR
jgi:diacylglycerol kinase